jgi:hypothetical protein
MSVEISNKVRLPFDRPKVKPFKVVGKSSNDSPLAPQNQNHGSVKCSGRNESSKRLGAQVKS